MSECADDRHERLLELIAKARQRSSDRVIIRTMRFAVWGLAALGVLFCAYIVAVLYVGAHDNRRLDELQQRVELLERVTRGRSAPDE